MIQKIKCGLEAMPTLQTGLVVAYFGQRVAVEAADGQLFSCHLHRNQTLPVVGDEVNWQPGAGGHVGTIVSILPRRSTFARRDKSGQMRVLAANIDVMAVVMVPPPGFSTYLLDRYLVAATLLGIKSCLIINKTDLLSEAELTAFKQQLAPYVALTDRILYTSVRVDADMAMLAAYFAHQTAVLVGPSGVGKSSIIHALTQDEAIKMADTSDKGIGKHTTTATRLYHLSQGGRLIDSPGVREFSLWSLSREDLLRSFTDFTPYLDQCQFRDCKHSKEPGCGLHQALKNGKISPNRLTSFETLLKETHVKTR